MQGDVDCTCFVISVYCLYKLVLFFHNDIDYLRSTTIYGGLGWNGVVRRFYFRHFFSLLLGNPYECPQSIRTSIHSSTPPPLTVSRTPRCGRQLAAGGRDRRRERLLPDGLQLAEPAPASGRGALPAAAAPRAGRPQPHLHARLRRWAPPSISRPIAWPNFGPTQRKRHFSP